MFVYPQRIVLQADTEDLADVIVMALRGLMPNVPVRDDRGLLNEI